MLYYIRCSGDLSGGKSVSGYYEDIWVILCQLELLIHNFKQTDGEKIQGYILELIDSGNVREVDSQVKELAQCNLNKLEIVTNKRVVHLEMNIESKIDIAVK